MWNVLRRFSLTAVAPAKTKTILFPLGFPFFVIVLIIDIKAKQEIDHVDRAQCRSRNVK